MELGAIHFSNPNRGQQKSPEGLSLGSPFASSLKKLLSRIVKFLLSDVTVLFQLRPFNQFVSDGERAKPFAFDNVNVIGIRNGFRFARKNTVRFNPLCVATQRA